MVSMMKNIDVVLVILLSNLNSYVFSVSTLSNLFVISTYNKKYCFLQCFKRSYEDYKTGFKKSVGLEITKRLGKNW